MKYMLCCDIFRIFKIKAHYFKSYMILILLILFILYLLRFDKMDVFYIIFGLEIKQNPIFMLTYILTRILFLFFSFLLFTYDFKNNVSNLFLRIKPFYWIVFRICSNVLILLFIKIFIYFFINFICFFLYDSWFSIFYILRYLFFDISYTLFFQMFLIFIYFLCQYRLFLSFILLILNIFILFPRLNFIYDYWWLYILLSLFYMVALIMFYKNQYIILFERNSDK